MLPRGFLAIQNSRQFGSISSAQNALFYANAVVRPSIQNCPCYMAWKTKVHTWSRHCHLCINAPMWREKRWLQGLFDSPSYLGWGQKSEFFCLLVTTRRLGSGTVWAIVVLRRPTVGTRQPRDIEVHQGKGQSKIPCHCLPRGHIQGHWLFTLVPCSEGLRVVPHLPCTPQPVSFRST